MLSTLVVAAVMVTSFQDTDITLPASGVSRVDVEQHNGSVVVRAWDRDEIRVQAEHGRRTEVDVRRRGSAVIIDTDGFPHVPVNYTIDLPSRMDLDLEGLKLDVEVRGVVGEIDIESVQGRVEITDGGGVLDVQTLSGGIDVDGFDGDVIASSTSQHITLRRVIGSLDVEAVSGLVGLFDIDATSLDIESISGGVEFSGSLDPGGHYFISSHSGEVIMNLQRGLSLTLEVANHSGQVHMDYPGAKLIESSHGEMLFELGDGGTRVEIETFSGAIRIR